MDKIYSRHRLPRVVVFSGGKLPKYKKYIILILVAIVIGYSTAIGIIKTMTPIIERQCRVEARSAATTYANEACKEKMANLSYEDLCTIERGSDGKITLIKMNSVIINQINNDVAISIQDKLNNGENSQFYISLGTFTGISLLAGRGPLVEIRMSTIGDVTTNIESEYTSSGINQTLHRIYINVNCNVSLITPFKDVDEEISMQILLVETAFAGDIPDTYYNLEGVTEDKLLETIN